MLPSEDDNVQFNILLEAAQALKELEYLRTDATTLQEVFDAVQAKVDATAKKMGVSFMAMEKNFQDVIKMSERLQMELAKMEALSPGMAGQALAANPRMAQLAQAQSPFGAVAQTTGWTEVNAIQKEILKNQIQELKLADATAKEINQQAVAEQKKVAERQKALALAQKELEAVEREGAAVQNQLKTYGQVRRTAQETMQYLRSFATTQQGQGILTQFFGDYKQASGVTQQIDTIKKAVGSLAQTTGASFSQAGQIIKEQFSAIPGMANQVNSAVKQMGQTFEEGGGQAVRGLDAIRIALGAIIAMIIFQAIQAVTQFFTEASKQARQLEETIYRLGNAERSLSLEGIEISLKGLEEGITRIQKLLPIFSREDISQLVGSIAVSTKQLGFTEQEILQLAQTVALLNVQSEKSEDLATTRQHVVSALLAGNSKGISELGVSFNEFAMQEKAVEMGLIEVGDSLNGLSDDTKAQIKLALLMEAANVDNAESMGRLNEFLDTNTAKIQANKSAWQDLLTTVGQGINNMIPDLTGFYESLQKGFEADKISGLFSEGLQKLMDQEGRGAINLQDVGIKWKLFFRADLAQEELDRVKEILSKLDQAELKKIFPDPSSIKDDNLRAIVESLIQIKDTATAIPDPLLNTDVDAEALDELDRAIEEIAIDAQQAKEDLAILLSQKQEDLEIKFQLKLEDLDTEYLQKAQDAAIDYANKIEDINLDAQQKIADAKDKARLDEQKAEMEFQLKMKELREEFLLDLEDALHARDARQVIRLQKQYALDKQKLIDRKNLEDQLRKEQLEADLKAIEVERQRRLEEAAREYEQKLQQLAIAKQRELEEINRWKEREQAELALWYERELAEIDRNTQHKLERLLAGYIEEEKIHEQSQAAIHAILQKWFGQNMALVDSLAAYTMQAFANMAVMAAGVFAGMSAAVPALPSSMAGAPAPYWDLASQSSGFAEGGTLFADKPTTVTFGERGPEAANFTPLGRVGRDEGKLFGNLSGNGNRDGKITLDITLSPDLEAKIIENTLGQTADVITRVSRSK